MKGADLQDERNGGGLDMLRESENGCCSKAVWFCFNFQVMAIDQR